VILSADDPVTGVLIQYGAVGVIALLGIMVSRVLFNRLNQALDRETARADRLESELSKLNETVRTEYVTTLAAASHAIQDANRAVADALSAVRRG
jgi:glucose-6-phosphate-specific signal transduction histidine kinase